MSNFGDFDDDDAYDTATADPEQVAVKIQRLRHEYGIDAGDWDALDHAARILRIGMAARLLAWLRRQGSLR